MAQKPSVKMPDLPQASTLASVMESSYEKEEEAKQLLAKKARTEDDLADEEFDLDKQLGGLNKIDVMDGLIEELS
eukprot:CAMPEP_0170493864 /NCGR_PEP_ID=MMETSP0208-20121228/14315_1 /TAXON_ID=197538 /ORGANISM="Strombidium inclinatum, Strain S3" /LENGTH=74 /DNA_ID=CAMNT_0010769845 /DNA_START=141 /DNA_END=368 /DNA_ORIENTATION=-